MDQWYLTTLVRTRLHWNYLENVVEDDDGLASVLWLLVLPQLSQPLDLRGSGAADGAAEPDPLVWAQAGAGNLLFGTKQLRGLQLICKKKKSKILNI